MKSVKNCLPEFSHIYIEEGAKNYQMTQVALNSFPKAENIIIDDYKEVFNRTNQNIFFQQKSKKLIIAVKKYPYLYQGTDILQDTKHRNVFYTTPLVNCVYHCDYCFLQGMYPSSNLVAFVNEEDFFTAVIKGIKKRKIKNEPLILSIAYNNDLLAFESKIPFCNSWIDFASKQKNLIVEIRTKSSNITQIKNIDSNNNVIFAWTLTPNEIRKNYEKLTPTLDRRLSAITVMISKGWNVRLCVDPVIYVKNWIYIYSKFFETIFSKINDKDIMDMVIGTFRMNKDYFGRIRKQNPKSELYYKSYHQSNGIIEPATLIQNEIKTELKKILKNYISLNKIYFWESETKTK